MYKRLFPGCARMYTRQSGAHTSRRTSTTPLTTPTHRLPPTSNPREPHHAPPRDRGQKPLRVLRCTGRRGWVPEQHAAHRRQGREKSASIAGNNKFHSGWLHEKQSRKEVAKALVRGPRQVLAYYKTAESRHQLAIIDLRTCGDIVLIPEKEEMFQIDLKIGPIVCRDQGGWPLHSGGSKVWPATDGHRG